MSSILTFCNRLGAAVLRMLDSLGAVTLFMLDGLRHIFSSPRIVPRTIQQLYVIGYKSLFVILLIGIFCGMVLGLQGYYTLVQFGSVGMLGSAVSLSLIRDLGPVLTAIMLAGRAGSSMAAEIGVMRISDQIDALDVMDINSMAYLVSPRLVASLLAFPLLTAIFDVIGIIGGYLTGVLMLHINEGAYLYRIASSVTMNDVAGGFIKSLVFGLLVATVCCHQGYTTHLRRDSVGPEAVGNATTSAVVISCVLILVADYVLTSFLLEVIMNAWDISFSSLSVGYGDHAVLHDINATLPGGKVSVILGGSGCGKSTLLRHIIGLSRPIGGSLRIGGQDLFSLPHAEARRIRRRMGVLFQDGALLGALTLVQNVCLPLSEHLRLPRSVLREAGLRVLRMVGLEDFADYFPNQLSGGMRKRAGLARALIAEPRILLCDEPTSGLDPITAARMDALLQAMHRQYPEMTLVVVSHDLASLRCIADHVLVLREGRAIFSGTLPELEASRDPYLRQFLRREGGDEESLADAPADPRVSAALDRWFRT